MDCSLPGSSVHGILHAKILEWVAISFSRGFPKQGIEPRSPALQVDSLLTELRGKPDIIMANYHPQTDIHSGGFAHLSIRGPGC